DPAVLAGLEWGGGYRTDLLLANPNAKAIRGKVAFFDRNGEPFAVSGAANEVSYEIAPDAAFRWNGTPDPSMAREIYAVVQPDGTDMPAGSALVSLWDKSLLVSQRMVPLRSVTSHAWITVDTSRSLIRNGSSSMAFTVANPDAVTPSAL